LYDRTFSVLGISIISLGPFGLASS